MKLTHNVGDHETLNPVPDDDAFCLADHKGREHRGYGGARQRDPPPTKPAVETVHGSVHKREIRQHELEPALRTT